MTSVTSPETPPLFTADDLTAALRPRPWRYFECVDSTNDIALQWLREGAPAGAVVIAAEQEKGRGRLGRSWFAPPSSALLLSVVLKPEQDHAGRVTMAGVVAVCEALEAVGAANVAIKWPNDALLNGRKVSGVLPEAVWEGASLLGVVLGIGINLRVDFAGTDLEATAISVEPALGRKIDPTALLVTLLQRVDFWVGQLDSPALFNAWKSRLVTVGQAISVVTASGVIEGKAEAVDEQGALYVRTAEGAVQRVLAGDIVAGK